MRKLNARSWLFAATAVALTASPVLAQENPFKDVPTNHWAYQAIQQLQKDGLVQGYPDGYFKGQRPLTRYEMAVVVARVMSKVESELANQPASVKPEDLAALRKLVDEYGTELKDVQKDVADLKTQVAANTATLNRQQFHLFWFLRAPGNFRDQVSAYDLATNAALPAQTALKSIGTNGLSGPGLTSGDNQHGTAWMTLRPIFSGNLDAHTSYSIRLEDRVYFDGTPQNGGGPQATGSGSAVTPPGASIFSSALRLNWAFLKYSDPSGAYAEVGRYIDEDGDLGLAWADYFTGAVVGYAKNGVNAYVGYSYNQPANAEGQTPVSGSLGQSQSILGRISYGPSKIGHIGLNYITDYSTNGVSTGSVFDTFRAGVGAVPRPVRVSVGSIDGTFNVPNTKLSLQGEALARLGKDPNTGSNYKDNYAFWGKAFYGDTAPVTGNSYIEASFIAAEANSTGTHTEVSGTPDYQNVYFNSPNGYAIYFAGVHHYFAPGAQIGIVVQGWKLLKNTVIPVTYINGGIATPGYINNETGHAVFLETKVAF